MQAFRRTSLPFCLWLCVAAIIVAGTPVAASGQVPVVQLTEKSSASKRADYQSYALRNQGDARRGKSVFENESKAACAKCHSTGGGLSKAGPDLFAVGDKFERGELIDALLQPSSRIAVGYGSTTVYDDNGKVHVGVLHRVTDRWIELLDQNSERVRISTRDIVEQQTSPLSLMPEGLENVMTRQEFADLIAYLETLRQTPQGPSNRAAHDEILPSAASVTLVPYFDEQVRFDHPVWFGQVPGSDNRFVVLEHFGMSWLIETHKNGDHREPFLDLSGVVRAGGATGLLGMAFHPDFRENRKYYLKFQIEDDGRISTVVEQRWFAKDGRRDSGRAPRRLLKIDGSTQDHNGGCVAFGSDGYLYIGMGDTGPQGDPQGHGQDLTTLLGKILRIDVDRTDEEHPYAIPSDNPFLRRPGARPEIWAYGFREPWRFSFDSQTGSLWVGDVGQDQFEEIAVVRAGDNHGWNVYEGAAQYSGHFRTSDTVYIDPIASYSRRLGFSVTGGHVYRGRQAPSMSGRYIFGDFESRRIWALRHDDGVLADIVEIGRSPSRIVSFAEDEHGELYLVGYDSGVIYHLDLQVVDPTPLKARAIADTSEVAPVPWRFSLTAPPKEWAESDFDDSSWSIGPGGFGTTGTPGAVVRTDWGTSDIWLRRQFILPPEAKHLQKLALRLHHDEDAEVYLNGVEVGRLTRWTTGYGEVPLSPASAAALRPGRNVLAIHCQQQSGGQYIDVGLVEYVTTN